MPVGGGVVASAGYVGRIAVAAQGGCVSVMVSEDFRRSWLSHLL